jgi:hypothetical protein
MQATAASYITYTAEKRRQKNQPMLGLDVVVPSRVHVPTPDIA